MDSYFTLSQGDIIVKGEGKKFYKPNQVEISLNFYVNDKTYGNLQRIHSRKRYHGVVREQDTQYLINIQNIITK